MSKEINQRWQWRSGDHAKLRRMFPGADLLEESHSQAFQDIWVLQALQGMRGGNYLEIGANHPVINNNTALMSSMYEWTGVSIEFDPSFLHAWATQRAKDTFLCADALALDYAQLIEASYPRGTTRIDYLQLDIEPSLNTLEVLRRMPLDQIRFSTITFETDAYAGDPTAKNESRKLLSSHGYLLICADVLVEYKPLSETPIPFEDWWVDGHLTEAFQFSDLQRGEACCPQELIFT